MTAKYYLPAVVLLAACASAPVTPAAPVLKTLAYAVPTPATASYSFTDSTELDIQGGAIGDIHVSIGASGLADVSYVAKGADVEASVRITKFSGAMTNSAMGGGPSATEAEIQGPAIATVTPEGDVTITSMPKLTPLIQRVGISQIFFHHFFTHLPGRALTTGASWVDTVSLNDASTPVRLTGRDIITSTLATDTTVNGRTVARITTTFQRNVTAAGSNEGVEIVQKLTGTGTGIVLWDADHHLLVDRSEKSEMSGAFDLPAMGLSGLPITAHSSNRITLR